MTENPSLDTVTVTVVVVVLVFISVLLLIAVVLIVVWRYLQKGKQKSKVGVLACSVVECDTCRIDSVKLLWLVHCPIIAPYLCSTTI